MAGCFPDPGIAIPDEQRAALNARRLELGWSWPRLAREARLGKTTAFGAIRSGVRVGDRVRAAIEQALSRGEFGAPEEIDLPDEPDTDSNEWREQLAESDRLFAEAMARYRRAA